MKGEAGRLRRTRHGHRDDQIDCERGRLVWVRQRQRSQDEDLMDHAGPVAEDAHEHEHERERGCGHLVLARVASVGVDVVPTRV